MVMDVPEWLRGVLEWSWLVLDGEKEENAEPLRAALDLHRTHPSR